MSRPKPALFDEVDVAAEAAAEARAKADVAAARVVSHKAMREWLLSWGTADEKQPPLDRD